jgi:hypothetical protein
LAAKRAYVSALPTPVPTLPSPGLTAPPEEPLPDAPELDPPPDEAPELERLDEESSAAASLVGETVPELEQRIASPMAHQPTRYVTLSRARLMFIPPRKQWPPPTRTIIGVPGRPERAAAGTDHAVVTEPTA